MCTGANISLATQAAGGIAGAYSQFNKSSGEATGYEYQSAVARNNAQLAEWQAQDAVERGKTTEGNVRMKGAQLRGTQEAIIGARNVALTEGSAANILADTKFMTERDALTARDNALREAWGYKNQSANYTSNAALLAARGASVNPGLDAAGTLLTSGGKVASSWYALRNKTTTAPERADSSYNPDAYYAQNSDIR